MPFEALAEIEDRLPDTSFFVYKNLSAIATVTQSLWTTAGLPAAGSHDASLAGALVNRTTPGALALPRLPATANSSHLARADFSHNAPGPSIIMFHDRLWHNTISATVTTSQTINSPTLSRYADGLHVQPWLHVTTATSATATTLSITYTNQAGVTGRVGSTVFTAAALAATRIFPLNLAPGDLGVRSIQSVEFTAAYTAGALNLVLRKPIVCVETRANRPDAQRADVIKLGMPSIMDDAALDMTILLTAGTSMLILMELNFIQE